MTLDRLQCNFLHLKVKLVNCESKFERLFNLERNTMVPFHLISKVVDKTPVPPKRLL